jgi:hypothetical protein
MYFQTYVYAPFLLPTELEHIPEVMLGIFEYYYILYI